ncbi:apolipoprotein N-acyltransferase [Campylobacter sp. MIT 99-7217]|uniref:apolipoprotein N-acyltransferase n=1 Tax=Campylobacter sp. MIT 99-7217 TaxID=535091 RepID=UPI0011575D50|nr:apolipoprotein N-acyltransferase [Campylobacter sp. MIT 99-7217]TQR33675.1 apolipoprotein N-acyltransferase [Campylobacter sp. MIT 99-7217]
MRLALNFVPFSFPFFKKLNPNSNIFKIIKAFTCAFFISNSIYLSFLENIFFELFSVFFAIYGFILLLRSDKFGYFWTGFFIGLLWFWWLSLSSIYFGLTYLVPFEILGVGLVYGILFRICYAFKYDFLRLTGIFLLSYLHILGFDWLNWGILTSFGVFESSLKGVVCIFLIAYFYHERYISRYYKIAIILGLFYLGIQLKDTPYESLNVDYKLIHTDISQSQKYFYENMQKNSDDLIAEIQKAIEEKKELVILPESAFAFNLERDFDGRYYAILQELSYQISIVVGAFSEQDDKVFNSTYVFEKGRDKILNKYYLVPFGEEIPFFKDTFRKYLMPNMAEFSRGERLNTYTIHDQNITNAICYEASKEELYKQSKIIVAISNNAWFDGFVEPSLQKLLMRYYANKYAVSIYHATNGEQTAIITPKQSIVKKYTLEAKDKILALLS